MNDFATRDNTRLTTGGDHYRPKLKGVRKPRKNHDHRVMLGKHPATHGVARTANKVITNNNGPDRSTVATAKHQKRSMRKHGISLSNS